MCIFVWTVQITQHVHITPIIDNEQLSNVIQSPQRIISSALFDTQSQDMEVERRTQGEGKNISQAVNRTVDITVCA